MKVLGFHLSRKPTAHAHVEAVRRKFRRQYWTLFSLLRAGFTQDELSKVYRTSILPIADYCQVVYHSILTDEQDQIIERLQSQALKIIFGLDIPYATMREKAGVKTLRQRRIDACDAFAAKYLQSENFKKWFPKREIARSGARNRPGETFVEEFARCDRLRNSPVFFMRRRLNGKPGKTYGERNRKYRDT